MDDNKEFKFGLGAEVEIAVSGERGYITGRAQYLDADSTYFVRYKAADGRAVEAWWNESALTEVL